MTTQPDAGRTLEGRIAVLFRIGLVISTVLFVAGVALRALGVDGVGSGLVVAGCAVLILLPVLRLVLMLEHFGRRRDRDLVAISALVLVLVAAAAAVGVLT